jgi:hypothetical protein
VRLSWDGPAIPDGARMTRLDRPFPQIATGDLDIPIIGQLPAANLPFGDEFEPGPVKVVGFEAPLRREGLRNQDLEDAPGNAHHSLIFADTNAELDHRASGFHRASGGKRKNMHLL